mgnify:CR=1 FL=1
MKFSPRSSDNLENVGAVLAKILSGANGRRKAFRTRAEYVRAVRARPIYYAMEDRSPTALGILFRAEANILHFYLGYAQPIDLTQVYLLFGKGFELHYHIRSGDRSDTLPHGFYDAEERRTFIYSQRGGARSGFLATLPETARHEIMHAHADHSDRLVRLSAGLNEGVTEYLASPDRLSDERYFELKAGVDVLVGAIGVRPFLEAHFNGRVDILEKAVEDRFGQGIFQRICEAADRARRGSRNAFIDLVMTLTRPVPFA